MGFNVAASLWVATSEHPNMRLQPETSSDFGSKLGLQSSTNQETQQQVESRAENAARDAHSLDAQQLTHQITTQQAAKTALARDLALRSYGLQGGGVNGDAVSPALVESYPLGLQAGHHLSYVAHTFADSALDSAMTDTQASSVLADAASAPHLEAPALVSNSAQHAEVRQANSPLLLAQSQGGESDAAPLSNEVAGYLSSRWPDHRWQLLAHQDGLELLIRDYHLSGDEQKELAADLLTRLSQSTQSPERIRINGQVVWQASPPASGIAAGETHHGN